MSLSENRFPIDVLVARHSDFDWLSPTIGVIDRACRDLGAPPPLEKGRVGVGINCSTEFDPHPTASRSEAHSRCSASALLAPRNGGRRPPMLPLSGGGLEPAARAQNTPPVSAWPIESIKITVQRCQAGLAARSETCGSTSCASCRAL